MTDLEVASLTDHELQQRLELAGTTMLLAQTTEQRARLMQLTADIMREQERRGLR